MWLLRNSNMFLWSVEIHTSVNAYGIANGVN